MPAAPTPYLPPVTPYQTPPFGYVPPNPGQFTGQAPTATPYGAFTAPSAANFQQDPSYQWRLSQGLKGMERSAAARGKLLTGGTLAAEQNYGQNAASQEYGNAYQRSLQSYGTNRDTNAQNFGQQQTGYQDALAAYQANTSATLGYGAQGLSAAEFGYNANSENLARQNAAQNQNAQGASQNNYQQQMAQYQAQSQAAQQQFAQQQQQQQWGYARRPRLQRQG